MNRHFSRNRSFYVNFAIGSLSTVIGGLILALILPMFSPPASKQIWAMRETSVARSADIVTALNTVADEGEEPPKYWPLVTSVFKSSSYTIFENVFLINNSKSSIDLEFYSSVPGRLMIGEQTVDVVSKGAYAHRLAPGTRVNATYFYQLNYVPANEFSENAALIVTADDRAVRFPTNTIRSHNTLAPLVRFLNLNELAGMFLVSTMFVAIAVLAFDRSKTVNIDITDATLTKLDNLILQLGAARKIVIGELPQSEQSQKSIGGAPKEETPDGADPSHRP